MTQAFSANATPRLSMSFDTRPATSSTTTATITSHPSHRAQAEFQNDMKSMLVGDWAPGWMKMGGGRKKSKDKPAAAPSLPRLSESRASVRRSSSIAESPVRPHTSQTTSRNLRSRPSSPLPTSPHKLPSLPSNMSLGSDSHAEGEKQPKKSTKRLWGMATPRDISRSTSPQRLPARNLPSRGSPRERDEDAVLETAMGQLPAIINPAAAKRLGIDVDAPTTAKPSSSASPVLGSVERPRGAFSPRPQSPSPLSPQPQSPVTRPSRPQSPAASLPQPPSKPTRLLNSPPSISSFASESTARPGTVSPITGKPRPEHPLEAQARIANSAAPSPNMPNLNSYFPNGKDTAPEPLGTTFYTSSSEDEDEDDHDDLRLSDYSYASSQTSYGLASPTDLDHKPQLDGANDWTSRVNGQRRPNAPNRPPPLRPQEENQNPSKHRTQSSVSSFSSYDTKRSSSASTNSVVKSFSRPFFRPIPSPDSGEFTNPRPAPRPVERSMPAAIGVADGQPLIQLAAIREDSPEPTEGDSEVGSAGSFDASFSHHRDSSSSQTISCVSMPKTNLDPAPMTDTKGPTRSAPLLKVTSEVNALPQADRRSARPLSLAIEKKSEVQITSSAAEATVLKILEALNSFDDLFVGARLNKGFFTVFKRHELRLMKNALRNMSPPQWELREASPKEIIVLAANGKPEYTPTLYVQFHKRDTMVIKGLKTLLLKECQPKLRQETVRALTERDPVNSARVDDAFWRIWTFCTIFGSGKAREHDIDAQVDWLRGGEDSRRPSTAESKATGLTQKGSHSKRTSTQISRDSFGQGNYGGLSMEELDDMVEIWGCLKGLLQGLTGPGRVIQARKCGIFDAQCAVPGDQDTEQALLEEWTYWLPTQGLSVIADMAEHTNARNATAFSVADDMEWNDWKALPGNQSRCNFLQDAIDRAREHRIAPKAFEQFAADMPVSERRKSRGMELAAQLRTKERGYDLDQPMDLWLAFTTQASQPRLTHPMPPPASRTLAQPMPPPTKPLPNPPVQQRQVLKPRSAEQVAKLQQRPLSRNPSTNSSNVPLSLFPKAGKTKMTPTSSARGSPTATPMRSRQNSVVRQADSIEKLRAAALKQARQGSSEENNKPQQLYTPRLSVCNEG